MLRDAGVAEPAHALILTTAISLSLAAMSWHFFEKPMIARFGRVPRGNGRGVA
jgi:peptidoglycan/LPS O-acetylase OafA/YrhL